MKFRFRAAGRRITLEYHRTSVLRGALMYGLGDAIAAVILDQFTIIRLVGMLVIGGTIYAFEVPNYFRWINIQLPGAKTVKRSVLRTFLAMMYFSPLWIFRHLVFIKLLLGKYSEIDFNLFTAACLSFLVNIPVASISNFLIQNKLRHKWRFLGSAIFSGLMAIYYALSGSYFSE